MLWIERAEITIYETLDTQLKRTIENNDLFGWIIFLTRL